MFAYVPVATALRMFNLDELQEIDVLFTHEGLGFCHDHPPGPVVLTLTGPGGARVLRQQGTDKDERDQDDQRRGQRRPTRPHHPGTAPSSLRFGSRGRCPGRMPSREPQQKKSLRRIDLPTP